MTSQLTPPRAELLQPVPTEPHVQLICWTSSVEFILALCYNLLLIVTCTWYAMKSRNVPDNYNESRYIVFCVYSTLVMWLAFIPTYYTTNRSDFRVALLSTTVMLNAFANLFCLFIVKLLIVLCVGGNRSSSVGDSHTHRGDVTEDRPGGSQRISTISLTPTPRKNNRADST